MRVGLVLGGGGAVGLAYHAGVLAALQIDRRWDPRLAEVIVGTSAGSIVGALLRRGVSAEDLAAVVVGAPLMEADDGLARHFQEAPALPPMGVRSFLRRPHLPNLALLSSWLLRPWRLTPLGALVSMLPDGEIDLFDYAGSLVGFLGDQWPENELLLTAVRQRDLRRVVFGLDLAAPLSTAVVASCSVPGYFAPVEIDGVRFVDGGVESPTNADVLVGRTDLDLVIVSSPMSTRDHLPVGIESAVRRYAKTQVDRELELLHASGVPTVLIEPSRDLARSAGVDFMSSDRLIEVCREAFFDAGQQLVAPFTRTLVAGL